MVGAFQKGSFIEEPIMGLKGLLIGGGFRYFFCSPLFGEDEPNLTIIFFLMG